MVELPVENDFLQFLVLEGKEGGVRKNFLIDPKIASMQHRSCFLSLNEEHNSSGAMIGINKSYGNSFLLLLIRVNPVGFIKLERIDQGSEVGKALSDQ